jgi:hypothetical protein
VVFLLEVTGVAEEPLPPAASSRPTPTEVERLLTREGVSRGRIWTTRDLADALEACLSPGDFFATALAKLALDAEVVAVRPRSS